LVSGGGGGLGDGGPWCGEGRGRSLERVIEKALQMSEMGVGHLTKGRHRKVEKAAKKVQNRKTSR